MSNSSQKMPAKKPQGSKTERRGAPDEAKKIAVPARKRKPLSPKQKREKNIRIALVVFAVLVIVSLLGVWLYHTILDHYLGKINIVTQEDLIYETEPLGETQTQTMEDHHGETDTKNLPLICNTKDVTNILLLATDARGKEAGLSDSMILLSINKKTEKIVLCSFLRDIQALFPEEPANPRAGKYDKLTHAHSYGGPELTMAVLKETFNIEVEHYAKVNFNSFIEVVDAVGGIDMYLSDSEIWWINEFVSSPEIAQIFPSYRKTGISGGAGTYHLNGLQALGHARNRRIGDDWARTERQRNIISQIMSQSKSLPLSQLNGLLDTVLPLITTNMPKGMLKDLVGSAISYLRYDVESTRVPLQGAYREENFQIIPDLEVNCRDLYEKIYGEAAK